MTNSKTKDIFFERSARLLTVMLLAAVVGCSPEPEVLEARPVKLTKVESADVSTMVEFAGSVQARVESAPGFRVNGKISQRLVSPGDVVHQGEVLMRLDRTDLQLEYTAALARRDGAKADWGLAETELKRFRGLHEQKFVSDVELDRAELAARRSRAVLDQTESELSQAKNRLDYANLKAVDAGVVTGVFVDVGDVVAPGTPVLSLVVDGPRDIVVDIPEGQRALAMATDAKLRLWAHGEQEYSVSLRELGAAADPVTRTFRARYSIDTKAPALEVGMTGVLRLRPAESIPGVLVPSASLIQLEQGAGVWVYDAEQGVMRHRSVEIVGVRGNDVLVQGVEPGELLALAGVHVITDGMPARAMEPVSAEQEAP